MATQTQPGIGLPPIPLLSPLKRYADTLARGLWHSSRGRRSGASTMPVSIARPRAITRVDQLWAPSPHSETPVLDIGEIIRAKDELMINTGMMRMNPAAQSPHSASADSEQTLVGCLSPASQRSSVATNSSHSHSSPLSDSHAADAQRSASLEIIPLRSLTAEPGRRLRHDYFKVATMDGEPCIRDTYKCPISTCGQSFAHFEQLQMHWTDHPWNRGGILTPVCEGGVRRLGWWEHKKKFFASLVQGRLAPEFPEDSVHDIECNRAPSRLRRRATSMDEVCRSDYGDISLRGSRTYCVSPRVVPMWQVALWECARDGATPRTLAGTRG
ncbi:hypothetical protein IW139_005743 [Coemansia sp. RSA 353]|nr:hypothetical protein GGH98_000101 [Coemansia sp. RSA 454]KAJ2287370.1 hypothetical protein IW139_005743 [Coemansia sp. RSA 353]